MVPLTAPGWLRITGVILYHNIMPDRSASAPISQQGNCVLKKKGLRGDLIKQGEEMK